MTDNSSSFTTPVVGRRTLLSALAVLPVAAACDSGSGSAGGSPPSSFTLTVATNAIKGGKNSAEAEWYANYVAPTFASQERNKGYDVTVTHQPSGVDDEQFKSKMALDLKSKSGADIIALDGIWVGEFAQAGYIKPLSDVVKSPDSWDGWSQIPDAVQANASFNGKSYGIPTGTDGRILYINKKLFAQANLPTDWQPTSWDDILTAGMSLKSLNGVTPVQINAGTAMGEATTMQGVLPLLVGTGVQVYENDKWLGNTSQLRDVLTFYKQLIDQGLEDKDFQLAAKGRDQSFQAFADGKVGILLESDYLWRSVINPDNGSSPMATRNTDVGWTFIPAKAAGAGVKGQDFVSMSGGGGLFLNPFSKLPEQAWELLQFLGSADAVKAQLQGAARITERKDVNAEVLSSDPLLSFVSQKVLPITFYRPGFAIYPQVSLALQQATADVVSGKSVDDAASTYGAAVTKLAGGADKVTSS